MAKKKSKNSKSSPFLVHHKVLIAVLLVAIATFSVLTINKVRAANLESVQYIMFCATDSGDKCNRNKILNLLLTANVRDWYKRQTGGYTFRFISPRENGLVKVIYGSHDTNWYLTHYDPPANVDPKPANSPSMNAFYNIYNEHVVDTSDDLISVLLLGFGIWDNSDGVCGLGAGAGLHFAIVDTANYPCNTNSNRRMVIAHESAHTFGVGHVCEGSNMLMAGTPVDWQPSSYPLSPADKDYINYCYGKGCSSITRGSCSFTPEQISELTNSPFFALNLPTTGPNSVYFTQAERDQP
jgi:hypothetical protein